MKQLKVIPNPENSCLIYDSDGHKTAACALFKHECAKIVTDEDGQLYCDKYQIIFVEVDDEE